MSCEEEKGKAKVVSESKGSSQYDHLPLYTSDRRERKIKRLAQPHL